MSIEALETHLTRALKEFSSINRLPELLALAQSEDPRVVYQATFALYRVFAVALVSPYYAARATSEMAQVRKWIEQQLEEFLKVLCGLLCHPTIDLRIGSLDILMSLLNYRSSSPVSSASAPLHLEHFRFLTRSILLPQELEASSSTRRQVIEMFAKKWFNKFWDIRWLMLREIELSLRADSSFPRLDQLPSNCLSLLECMTPLPLEADFWITSLNTKSSRSSELPDEPSAAKDEDDWRVFFAETPAALSMASQPRSHKFSVFAAVHSASAQQDRLASCWIILLPTLASSAELSARALQTLHSYVTPNFRHSAKIMDWVAGCVDYGGSIGLLALNVMYQLITMHNLDYPDFYNRLYGFLDRDCLHMKYRSRFLRLLERFLSSTHLPTNLLASFVKRLARLSLSAPSSAIVALIPLIYNVMHLHPQLMIMIHSPNKSGADDPFDAAAPSPFDTGAIDSSLWELVALQSHHNNAVAGLARVFSESFSKTAYSLEDFLDQTYSTFFRSEIRKTMTYDPPLQNAPYGTEFIGWSLS